MYKQDIEKLIKQKKEEVETLTAQLNSDMYWIGEHGAKINKYYSMRRETANLLKKLENDLKTAESDPDVILSDA